MTSVVVFKPKEIKDTRTVFEKYPDLCVAVGFLPNQGNEDALKKSS